VIVPFFWISFFLLSVHISGKCIRNNLEMSELIKIYIFQKMKIYIPTS